MVVFTYNKVRRGCLEMQKNGFSKDSLNETSGLSGDDSPVPTHGKGYMDPEKSGGEVRSYQDKKEAGYFPGRSQGPKLITLDILSRAIHNRIGIGMEEARRDAGFVLDIVWPSGRTIDNVLDPEDRQNFYILEEEGMIATEREETNLYDGREWRTHYWVLKEDVILEYAKEDYRREPVFKTEIEKDDDNGSIYDTLDKEWSSRKNTAGAKQKSAEDAYKSDINRKIRESQT
jgi:hypothetical protein